MRALTFSVELRALGEYAAAATEYEEAFRLRQDPALLYNAAQAYRLAGDLDKALLLYRSYAALFPGEPNVDEVKTQIVRLKQSIAAGNHTKPTPPAAAPTVLSPAPPAASGST